RALSLGDVLRSPGDMCSPGVARIRQLLGFLMVPRRYLSPSEANRHGLC
ncbi:hypothetical protein A2U01_0092970, partial [Trifolium medium]|nr:hypothetical protein [Trifolium medium]